MKVRTLVPEMVLSKYSMSYIYTIHSQYKVAMTSTSTTQHITMGPWYWFHCSISRPHSTLQLSQLRSYKKWQEVYIKVLVAYAGWNWCDRKIQTLGDAEMVWEGSIAVVERWNYSIRWRNGLRYCDIGWCGVGVFIRVSLVVCKIMRGESDGILTYKE